ncbi:MAG TPA: hypothetical protein VKA34_13405, partial [Balneolales bacterium]|nr:hypothetical protein [Balneolales bacterium]
FDPNLDFTSIDPTLPSASGKRTIKLRFALQPARNMAIIMQKIFIFHECNESPAVINFKD